MEVSPTLPRTRLISGRLRLCLQLTAVVLCILGMFSQCCAGTETTQLDGYGDYGWVDIPVIRPEPKFEIDPKRVNLEQALNRSVYGHDEDSGIQHLQESARNALAKVAENYELTAADLKKLSLAARGDIRHYVERVTAFRNRHIGPGIAIQNFQTYTTELAELRRQRSDEQLLGPESLFGKSLRKIVTNTSRRPDPARDEREQLEMRNLLSKHLPAEAPLRDEQRKKIVELLDRKIQTSIVILFQEQLEQQFIQRLVDIPTTEYEKVLEPQQLQFLLRNLDIAQKKLNEPIPAPRLLPKF